MSGLIPPGPLSYTGQLVVPYVREAFPPQSTFTQYTVPTVWVDTATEISYILTANKYVAGVKTANWVRISDGANSFPITPYVVGPAGQAGYQTIQSAINAAHAAGSGAVYIQPGTYTENLTLYTGVSLTGVEGNVDSLHIKIIGTHTPPTDNATCSFRNLNFYGTDKIFFSAAAGEAYLAFDTCNFILSVDGYVFDLDNWVGPTGLVTGEAGIGWDNCGDLSTAESGSIKNSAGGCGIAIINSYIGSLTGTGTVPMLISGELQLSISDIFCPITLSGSSTDTFIEQCNFHGSGMTVSGSTSGTISNSNFTGLTSAAFTMSSSAAWDLLITGIDTSNNPAIAGAGAGVLTIADITFLSNSVIAGTVTVGTASQTQVGALKIKNYTMPLADGTANQVITTNGSGTLTFATNAGGNVTGPSPSTDRAISTWNGITGTALFDNPDVTISSVGNIQTAPTNVGGTTQITIFNQDNTNANSTAINFINVGGASAGDPRTVWTVQGITSWGAGIDNSDSDSWNLEPASSAFSAPVLKATTAGDISVPAGNLSVSRAAIGSAVQSSVVNTDNTNASSDARQDISVGGASGGSPFQVFTVTGATSWTHGIDNGDSDIYKISNSNGLLGTGTGLTIDTSGTVQIPGGDLYVSRTNIGGLVQSIVANNDTTDANSAVRLGLLPKGVAAGTTGDAYLHFDPQSGSGFAFQMGYSQANNAIEIHSGVNSAVNNMSGTTVFKATQDGAVTMPLQPRAFMSLSSPTGAVTGDGTTYTILYDQTEYLQGISYNAGTGVFTVNESGTYQIAMRTTLGSISGAMTKGAIGLSGSIGPSFFVNNPANARNSDNQMDAIFFYQEELVAGNTFSSYIQITNGALAAVVNNGTSIWVTLIN